jgi:glucuronokinase
LIGNPSDGYHGKTIALTVKNFRARITLYESPEMEIIRAREDLTRFDSVDALVSDVRLHGYYGGVRLLKASIKRFVEYCRNAGKTLPAKNFTIRYETDVPRLVGLAGSSAIITATMRALMQFYDVEIPKPELPSMVLSVETDELGIQAGLQDRVAQTYEGVVYMDFDRAYMAEHGHGRYEPLDPSGLPPLYLAYDDRRAEPTERPHSAVRDMYDRGDAKVVKVMQQIAGLVDEARECIDRRDAAGLSRLIDRNFDLRSEVFDISAENQAMIDAARSAGASAKFTGSGGAIIGIYDSPNTLERARGALEDLGCSVILPKVV